MTNGIDKLAKSWKKRTLEIYLQHPEWNATEVRDQLTVWLGKDNTPGKSSVQKELARLIYVYSQIRDLDIPWHLGTLENHPLSPKAVPYILLVQDYAEKYPDPHFKKPQSLVTIRQAKWIARFCAMVGDIHRLKDKKKDKKKGKTKLEAAAYLYDWSKTYATHEIICNLSGSGTQFDTSELDKSFRDGSTPVVIGDQYVLLHRDRSFTVDPRTFQQFEKSQREGEK